MKRKNAVAGVEGIGPTSESDWMESHWLLWVGISLPSELFAARLEGGNRWAFRILSTWEKVPKNRFSKTLGTQRENILDAHRRTLTWLPAGSLPVKKRSSCLGREDPRAAEIEEGSPFSV